MLSLSGFTLLVLGMAAASAALGYFFPECLLQKAAQWILYGVAGLLVSVVVYTLLMAWAVR